MKKIITLLGIMFLSLAVLASCGDQDGAEKAIDDFQANMSKATEIEITSNGSTQTITDAEIIAAAADGMKSITSIELKANDKVTKKGDSFIIEQAVGSDKTKIIISSKSLEYSDESQSGKLVIKK